MENTSARKRGRPRLSDDRRRRAMGIPFSLAEWDTLRSASVVLQVPITALVRDAALKTAARALKQPRNGS